MGHSLCVTTQHGYKGLVAAGGRCICSGARIQRPEQVHMLMHESCQIVMIWSQHRGSAPKDGVLIMYHHTAEGPPGLPLQTVNAPAVCMQLYSGLARVGLCAQKQTAVHPNCQKVMMWVSTGAFSSETWCIYYGISLQLVCTLKKLFSTWPAPCLSVNPMQGAAPEAGLPTKHTVGS